MDGSSGLHDDSGPSSGGMAQEEMTGRLAFSRPHVNTPFLTNIRDYGFGTVRLIDFPFM
jgi:hypothetical protein